MHGAHLPYPFLLPSRLIFVIFSLLLSHQLCIFLYIYLRAWACRGAQLSCQNGEVCLVLGDDSSGKSRLLTALAESIVLPPSNSRSTVFVRGQVHIGGVDVTRWDRRRLKRSLGLVLNDVRTLSDMAQLLSGCTLEEILNPGNGGGGGPGSPSYNAMQIAMQVR